MRRAYAGVAVDLDEPRWVFLNTLFTYSEACLFAQLVDLLDARKLEGAMGYADLYPAVRATLDAAHLEGQLKAEIVADPQRFVVLDSEAPLTLLDQKVAGKKLLLVTNSDWGFTRSMMSFAFDRYLPQDMKWRDLFDTIIVSARKPSFFSRRNPLFEVVDEERGLLAPTWRGLEKGGVFFGGNATLVEQHLGLSGDEILYVGDHLYSDLHMSKATLRWRTALILRELEQEVLDLIAFKPTQAKLTALMAEKEELEREVCALRLTEQRRRRRYGATSTAAGAGGDTEARLAERRAQLVALDDRIAPLAKASGELGNSTWGPLMRAGNDKSLFARQVERSADAYTGRVSNFLHVTPFGFLRAGRSTLPHDQN
jgi:HAD superfamily 5'-nucleotidase-like hydrolase